MSLPGILSPMTRSMFPEKDSTPKFHLEETIDQSQSISLAGVLSGMRFRREKVESAGNREVRTSFLDGRREENLRGEFLIQCYFSCSVFSFMFLVICCQLTLCVLLTSFMNTLLL